MIVLRRFALAAALSVVASFGIRRGLSRAEAGRLDRQGFPLPHRRGDARAAPALHDGRRADRRAGADPARHRRLRRELPDAGLRRRAVRRGPAARRHEVLHHPARRDRRRQIGQAVRRPAREVPALQLRRHGRGAVPAGDRRPRRQPPAPGDRQLDGRHADLDVGRGLSGLHGRAGADGVAADRDVEPQLDDAADDHRRDPQRSRLEQRQLHHAAARIPHRQRVLRHRHQRRHAGAIRRRRRRARRPTSCRTTRWRRRSTPTPTTSSTSGTPRATTTRRRAWSGSRPRCWRSIRRTTSAIRRRPG